MKISHFSFAKERARSHALHGADQHNVAVAAARGDAQALRGHAHVVPRAGEVGEDVLRRVGQPAPHPLAPGRVERAVRVEGEAGDAAPRPRRLVHHAPPRLRAKARGGAW